MRTTPRWIALLLALSALGDEPQSATVWVGGAVSFTVTNGSSGGTTCQWQRNGTNLPAATAATLYLSQVFSSDSGSAFRCLASSGGITTTSAVATLTVVPNNAANVAAYRNAVQAEPSLVAFFPVDNNTGTTLTNVADGSRTHDGTLELNTTYDGRTNTSFGQRALSFNANGDVQIPNNPAFEFGNAAGNGTLEMLVDLSQPLSTDPTIFAQACDGGGNSYLALRASGDANSLIYLNDSISPVSWLVPGGLIGRLSHVALVFDHITNVTAYVNGQNLGTHAQAGFGSALGCPAWIGSMGTSMTDNRQAGTIDELAIYGSALSSATIRVHYGKFVSGTNTSPPAIISQPVSKTLLAGASPVLIVQAAGAQPLSYQWTSNGVAIPGATTASLALSNATSQASYSLAFTNLYGSTNTQPILLAFAAPPAGYPATVMNDHPTTFWRLSEAGGTTAADSAGFSDGTYSGGFTLGVPAFPGNAETAARFDGASGKAIIPLTPVLNPVGPFSCEFWASPTTVASCVPVGSMDQPGRSGGYEFSLSGTHPGWEFLTAASGAYSAVDGDNTSPAPGSWSYVVGTYDGTNLYLYVNGTPANPDFSAPLSLTPNAVKGFYIGSQADNLRSFNGAVADVAFYSYALSFQQISNRYAPFVPPKFTSMELSNGQLTLRWSGFQATILESTNLTEWAAVPGNPNPLIVNVTSAPCAFYRLKQ